MNHEYAKFVAPAQLEIIRDLPASCDRVWEYLTDPELRKQWFCAGATGSKPDEEFVMDFDHTRLSTSAPPAGFECSGEPVVVRGTIITFEPPHKLAFRWPGESDEDESIVTIELTQQGENTRLHLVHSKLTNPEFQKGASAGWHAHLDLLVDLIQGLVVGAPNDVYGGYHLPLDVSHYNGVYINVIKDDQFSAPLDVTLKLPMGVQGVGKGVDQVGRQRRG